MKRNIHKDLCRILIEAISNRLGTSKTLPSSLKLIFFYFQLCSLTSPPVFFHSFAFSQASPHLIPRVFSSSSFLLTPCFAWPYSLPSLLVGPSQCHFKTPVPFLVLWTMCMIQPSQLPSLDLFCGWSGSGILQELFICNLVCSKYFEDISEVVIVEEVQRQTKPIAQWGAHIFLHPPPSKNCTKSSKFTIPY